jgi:hypothetical protein
MGLDLWFRDDVRRILAAKLQAAQRDKNGDELVGYVQCLHDLAVEFGIDDPRVKKPGVYDQQDEAWLGTGGST